MRQPEGKLAHMTNVNSTLTTHGLTTHATSDPRGWGRRVRGGGGVLWGRSYCGPRFPVWPIDINRRFCKPPKASMRAQQG